MTWPLLPTVTQAWNIDQGHKTPCCGQTLKVSHILWSLCIIAYGWARNLGDFKSLPLLHINCTCSPSSSSGITLFSLSTTVHLRKLGAAVAEWLSLGCGARGPGFDPRPRHLNFQRLVISSFQVAIWLKYRWNDVNPQYKQLTNLWKLIMISMFPIWYRCTYEVLVSIPSLFLELGRSESQSKTIHSRKNCI